VSLLKTLAHSARSPHALTLTVVRTLEKENPMERQLVEMAQREELARARIREEKLRVETEKYLRAQRVAELMTVRISFV
jgi:hypothetical protein